MASHGNSTFKGEYCARLVEMGKTGCCVAEFCATIPICKYTFYQWIDKYPDFAKAYRVHNALSEAYWIQLGKDNIGNPDFNASMYHLQLGSRFGISKTRKIRTKFIDPKHIMKSLDAIIGAYESTDISLEEFDALVKALLNLANIQQHEEITARVSALEERLAQKNDEDDE